MLAKKHLLFTSLGDSPKVGEIWKWENGFVEQYYIILSVNNFKEGTYWGLFLGSNPPKRFVSKQGWTRMA